MFNKLFEPLQVGTITLKNRLVMTPMSSKLTDAAHQATPRAAAYYAARAAGGFALVETGYLSVMENSLADPYQGAIYDDSFIPGLALIPEAVHRAAPDAKVFAQLVHTGNLADRSQFEGEAVGTSAMPASVSAAPVHELTTAEVYDVIDAFADAAERAQKAGFDGVEVHGAHGYLVNQFLSKRTNKRADEFGGSTVERTRFACEIINAIKERCGRDYPVSIRFNATDDVEGGNVLSDYVAQARAFEVAGADLLSVSFGTAESGTVINSNYTPAGFNAPNARVIREQVSIPVLVTGRVNDPAVAERIVRGGSADLVGLGRQSLADPTFPNKVREGRLAELICCTGCMQRCIGMPTCGPEDTGVSCMLNPFSGKEVLPEWQVVRTDEPKKVVVVGAGPSGLEAARVAAERGHQVTVLERADKPGGQYNLAAMPPNKSELAKTIKTYTVLATRAGATIRYNTEATPEALAALSPDAVVLATGATPLWLPIPGIEGSRVVKANDVLAGRVVLGREKRVLVVGAGLVGCETAEFLTMYDHDLTIVDMVPQMAALLNPVPRKRLLARFAKHNVRFVPNAKVLEFLENGVRAQPVARDAAGKPVDKGEPIELTGFDYIVVAMGARAYNPLEQAAREICDEVYVVGDARRAGDAKKAIYEAARAALAL